MFCSACGTQVQVGLSYCNKCGKRVVDLAEESKQSDLVLAYVGGTGFVAYIFVILVLTKSSIPPAFLVPITLFYFVALFAVCFLVFKQTRPVTKGDRLPVEAQDDIRPVYLRPPTTAQLQEPNDLTPARSVTEHTTRTLDEVRIERQR